MMAVGRRIVCVCVDVRGLVHCCVFACVWVSQFILLGVFPVAAYTNQTEETSLDETPTLCQPAMKERLSEYLRSHHSLAHTHTHTPYMTTG